MRRFGFARWNGRVCDYTDGRLSLYANMLFAEFDAY